MTTDINTVLTDAWTRITVGFQLTLDHAARTYEAAMQWVLANFGPWLAFVGLDGPSEQRIAINTMFMLAAGLLVLFVLMTLGRLGQLRQTNADLKDLTRRPRRMGYVAVAVLLAFFGGWSLYAPLSSATVAQGVVSPDGSRKSIAHLEGGIIQTIHVQEGDIVRAGSPVLTLEDVHARAQLEEMQERYLHLLAIEARLLALRSGEVEISFPDELTQFEDPGASQVMAAQKELLDSITATQLSRERILQQRMLQLDEQNAGLEAVTIAQDRQLDLLNQEITDMESLLERGLAQLPRVLALKRTQAALEAERASNRAMIAENNQRRGETEIQLISMREEVVETANDQLANIQRQLAELRSRMPSREDVLERTVIRAPITGTVMNVQATTESGVVRPGEIILEIVPQEASLIIDAKVRPIDIDRVTPGMEARVILSAYRQRNLPLIHGVLRSISADRLVEDRTGEPYFLAKVEVNGADLDGLEDVRLMPGMPADVMILNGEQTLMQYLLDPFMQSVRRSFRES